jgi:hypothetical protein
MAEDAPVPAREGGGIGGQIWSVEHSLEFIPREVGDQARIGFPERNRQNAADLLQDCWTSISRKWKQDLIAAGRTQRVTFESSCSD